MQCTSKTVTKKKLKIVQLSLHCFEIQAIKSFVINLESESLLDTLLSLIVFTMQLKTSYSTI
jgi:hypothetical protein